jgi:putative transposase
MTTFTTAFLTHRGVNAVMESFFATLKGELAARFATVDEATRLLFDYIEVFYNQRRRHSTLGQISPAAFERRPIQAA